MLHVAVLSTGLNAVLPYFSIPACMATASYVYVAEISQAEHRGTLSAAGPIHVSFGVLAVYILGYIAKWQLVAAVCTVCAVLSFVAMCMVPESPPWLASQGRVGEAKAALVWLGRSPSNAEAELDELLDSVCKEKNTNNNSTNGPVTFKSKLKDKARPFQKQTVWKPFIILVLFFAFQEGSGIYIILYYAVNLFEEVGTGLNEFVASIIVGGVRLVMSIVGTILIRNFGRKTLAVASGIGMGMSMAVGGAYEHFYSYLPSSERPLIWIPLLCVLVHVCISMIGFLQLPWIMNGELFPLKIRGVMGGLVAFLAHLFIFTSVKTYPNVTHSFGMDGTLWFFSVASFSGALYCFMFLPETRGKTLHEIELAFKNKNSVIELKGKLKSNRCSRGNLFITENKPKIKDIEKGTRNYGFIGSTESIVAGEIPVYSIGGQYINNKLTDF
uniref:Major facilitator superfamily (MFS) profile domain-containing protein n=1 Tax=Timema cristinae TaxID=61476 RepID=A0A7R9DCM2_TIMCR|nr:unnamed protein product [Timema cristinae]